jgi:hypothetical protein
MSFLLCVKLGALDAYKSFKQWAITQGHCTTIKVLHSDRGGEFLSKAFDKYLTTAGTACKLTMHNTPEWNGVAEWLNCTLLERIHTFTHLTSLPKTLWGEAL